MINLLQKFKKCRANKKLILITTATIIILAGFGFTQEALAGYYATGTLVSTNLLEGKEPVGSIDSFFTSSTIATGTSLWVQFATTSTEGPWYNATGTPDATTTVLNGTSTIDLSKLGWSGPNFYYKMFFNSNAAKDATPELDEIRIDYIGFPFYTLGTGTEQTINIAGYLKVGDGIDEMTVTGATYNPVLDVDGNFTISTNATFIAPTSSSFTIGGNWSNSGTFNHSTGTVTFDTASVTSTIYDSNTFYNLSCTTSDKNIAFEADATTTVSGTLTLTGALGQLIILRSSAANYWYLTAQANNVSYVDVQYSDATSSAEAIDDTLGGVDSGYNINWLFPANLDQTHYRWRNDDGVEDGGTNWEAAQSNLPADMYVFSLTTATFSNINYLYAGGYYGTVPKIYRTSDGTNWEAATSGLPADMQVRSLNTATFSTSTTYLYAGGYDGTVPKIYRTSDGTNWSAATSGLPTNMSVFSLNTATFSDTNYLYAGGRADTVPKIYRTSDGTNWEIATSGLLADMYVFSLNTATFSNTNYLYAGGYDSDNAPKIYRTSDGTNWETATSGLPDGMKVFSLPTATFSNINYLYAGGYYGTVPKIYRTSDGTNWETATSGLSADMQVRSLNTATFSNTNYLYAGGVYSAVPKIYRTSDGTNWETATSGLSDNMSVYSLNTATFSDTNYLYAGGYDGSVPKIYRTSDSIGAATWMAAEDTATTTSTGVNVRVRFSLKNTGGTASNYNYRLQYATSSTSTCELEPSGNFVDVSTTTDSNVLVMATSTYFDDGDDAHGLLSSGDDWSAAQSGLPADMRVRSLTTATFSNTNYLYAGGYDGSSNAPKIYQTSDGTNWQAATSGLPTNMRVFSLNTATFSTSTTYLYAGGYDNSSKVPKIYRTSDGTNWQAATSGLPTDMLVYSLKTATFSTSTTYLYAGGYDSSSGVPKIYRTSDGTNWSTTTSGLPDGIMNVRSLTTANFSTSTTYLYAGGYDGSLHPKIYRTSDGTNWSTTTSGLPANMLVRFLTTATFSNTNYLYAGGYCGAASEIYRTSDGTNWQAATSGLPAGIFVLSLNTATFSDTNYLYAGGYSGTVPKIYRTSDGFSWQAATSGLPANMKVNSLNTATFSDTNYLYAGGDDGSNAPEIYRTLGFTIGKMVEYPSNQTANHTLNQNFYTEHEYVFKFTDSAPASTTYCFRMAKGENGTTTDLDSYTQVAKITTALPNVDETHYRWRNDDGGEALGGWTKKKSIPIYNSTSTDLTDYQVKIDVDYDDDMQDDFDDLRFTDSNETTILDYWLEGYTTSSTSTVWVKIPSLPGDTTTTIYMYYGNLTASSTSNGDNTFVFFDDFDDGSIDTNKWTTSTAGTGSVSESGSTVNVHTDAAVDSSADLISTSTYGPDVAVRMRANISAGQMFDHKGLGFLATNVEGDTVTAGDGVYWRGQDSDLYTVTEYSGTATTTNYEPSYAGGYRTWEIKWLTSEVKYYFNDDLKDTLTANIPPVAITPRFSLNSYSSAPTNPLDIYADWILIRKYTSSTEPSVGAAGSEETGGASWMAPEDTATSTEKNTNLRVRFSVKNTGSATTSNYRLQWAEMTGHDNCTSVTSTAFQDISTTTDSYPVVMATSTYFDDQDTTTNLPGLTDPSNGFTWTAGRMVEYSSYQTNPITLNYNYFTENEYVFKFTDYATSGLDYCFRMAKGENSSTTDLDSYSKVAKITIPAPSVITVGGTIYSDEGETVYDCSLTSLTVSLRVNGTSTATTTCTTSTGAYTISDVSASTSDVITVFLDGETEKAVTVTRAASTDINDLHLYQSRVIVRHDDSGPITNTNLDQYGGNQDPDDIKFTVSGGGLTASSTHMLYIWPGTEFKPGGTVTTEVGATSTPPGGDIKIASSTSIFNVATNSVSCGGDWTNLGTFSKSANQTTTFTATSTGFSINNGTSTFENVTFNGSGGGWELTTSTTIDADLTITAGTVTAPSGTLTIGNNYNNSGGTFTHNSGTVLFNAGDSGNTIAGTLNGNSAFYNLTFNNSNGVWDFQNNASTTNDLTITAGTLDLSGQDLEVGGTLSVLGILKADVDAGTVTLSGAGNFGGPGTTTVYNLTLSGTTTLAGDIDVNNDFSISSGQSLDVSGSYYGITVGGSWSNSGTFTAQNGKVTFDATTTENITSGGSDFYQLEFNGSGQWTFQDAATATATTTLTVGTLVHGGDNNLTLASFTLATSTTFTMATGTGKLIFSSANPIYIEDQNTTKQNLGNVYIGASPAVTNQNSDIVVESLTVNAENTHNTRGYEIDCTTFITVNGANGTLNALDTKETDGTIITLGTNWTVASDAIFTADETENTSTTIIFDEGTASTISPGGIDENHDFYNFEVAKTAATTTTLLEAIHIENNLNISTSSSTLDVSTSNYDINVGGSWSNSGSFIARLATTTFDAAAVGKTIDPGGSAFYNLTFDGSGGGWTFSANATTSNDLNLTDGTVTSTSGVLYVGGDWNATSTCTFNHNNGEVMFYATSTGHTITDGGSPFYLLTFNSAGGSGEHTYIVNDSDAQAYEGQAADGDFNDGSENEFISGEYGLIDDDDSEYVQDRSADVYQYHRFDFTIEESVSTITQIDITWRGVGGRVEGGVEPSFSGETQVRTSAGDLTFLELYKAYQDQEALPLISYLRDGKIYQGHIQKVTQNKYVGDLITLTLSNGEELYATPGHPILTDAIKDEYIEAEKITVGAKLPSLPPENITVTEKKIVKFNGYVYDLTVREFHNFLLSSGLFVHNELTLDEYGHSLWVKESGSWAENASGTATSKETLTVQYTSGFEDIISSSHLHVAAQSDYPQAGETDSVINSYYLEVKVTYTTDGNGTWLYQDSTSTAPATTTMHAGTSTFLNAKTGNISVDGGQLNVDWYLGIHVVDKDDTDHNINTTGTDPIVILEASSSAAIWRHNGTDWIGPVSSTSTDSGDSGKNPQPNDNLAIRIREYSKTNTTTTFYKYNVTTTAQSGYGAYDYSADHRSGKFIISTLYTGEDQDDCISQTWHRTTISALNEPYPTVNNPPDKGSWFVGMASALEFSVSATSTDLGSLDIGNDWTANGTTTLSVTTTAYNGYVVKAYADNNGSLRLGATENYIDRWVRDVATNATPTSWDVNCSASSSYCAFGYTTSDDTLTGGTLDRFTDYNFCSATTTNKCWAGFATSSVSTDPVADATSTVSGATTTITYKVSADSDFVAGNYSTKIYYICTANY